MATKPRTTDDLMLRLENVDIEQISLVELARIVREEQQYPNFFLAVVIAKALKRTQKRYSQ